MNRGFVIGLDGSGIQEMLDGIEAYKAWLNERTGELVRKLAERGMNIASVGFVNAPYSGENDVTVTVDHRGELVSAVVATGNAALFLEFGTGITYPDNHPLAHELGMIRGEYGKGHGKQRTWAYYGDPGTNGWPAVRTSKDGRMVERAGVSLTHGDPASMPMYNAVKELELEIASVAREVFADG